MNVDLPEYEEEEYERVSHKNNQTEDVRVREKDGDYIVLDFETGVAGWGDTRERAILDIGKSLIVYRHRDRSGEIVQTDDTLGGDPRVDGSRIGVENIVNMAKGVDTLAELAASFSGVLTIQEVKRALEWADENPEIMEEIHRERELFNRFVQEEWEEDIEGVYSPREDSPSFEEWRDQNDL